MEILLGLLIIAIGSFGQSSSYVPIKKVKSWAWESFWIVQGIFAWLVFPFLGALLGVPQGMGLFELLGSGGALKSIVYGVLWGVGGLTFGLSMRYLGVALGQSISLGTCAGFGTLLPAIFAGTNLFRGEGLILLVGVCITLAGIAVIGYAGSLRSKNMTEEEKKASLKETNEYEKTASYIAEIVKGLGLPECSVKTFADDEEIVFELDCGDDYGIVIGRRGETLDAIQYLARMVANRGVSGYKRVSINIGNYREKRKGALVSLAKKDAARAVRTGRNITLEPMNPYERRIIHTAVQEVEGATSFSVGQDLDRRVVIAPENGGKGSYGDRNYRRGRGGRNDRRPKREPYVPQVAPDREQKNEAAGVSVYGKIEIKKNTEE